MRNIWWFTEEQKLRAILGPGKVRWLAFPPDGQSKKLKYTIAISAMSLH